jgi:hypothetical protein
MSFWVWVGVALVVVLAVALVSDRRRRGGWLQGYSNADGQNRSERERADGDQNASRDIGGGPGSGV